MAGEVVAGADALVVDEKDHVATALKDIQEGDTIHYRSKDQFVTVVALDPIPFGHKVALVDMEEGTHVMKYGEVIGRATVMIERGRHVHVHNVEGIRGRGDQSQGA
ncbi:UxaA family hydrolase [Paenibacillus terrigena]|uniref:UxaA family hydrolase n=1 Tax=Paenibacillus terrigena TaxID=369333 RepID=UPI0028D6C0DD|nr:UxaA family hydrolase [Paenibacillus terrigena]